MIKKFPIEFVILASQSNLRENKNKKKINQEDLVMRLLNEILEFNNEFVEKKKYEEYISTKFPDKRFVVFTCMDTRLVELLPKAMKIRNGDVKMVKNAGAILSHPFGSVMKSLLIAVYELQADEIFVVGHHDCGMTGINSESTLEKMKERGVSQQTLEDLKGAGIDIPKWMKGFSDAKENVLNSVRTIRQHPLMPKDVPTHGLVIDPTTGKLELIDCGY
jgi:carbonic anhydrase